MRANTRYSFTFDRTRKASDPVLSKSAGCRLFFRALGLSVMTLGLLLASAGQFQVYCYADSQAAANIDSRWLPWMGSWRLVSDTADTNADTNAKESKDGYLLNIGPGEDGRAVAMKALRGETVLFDDAIIANGLSQPLREKECSGWYQYSWSSSGKRLLFESESGCPGELTKKISGLSIINGSGEWLDIQLLQSAEERIITIRRYAPVSEAPGDSEKYRIGRVRTARIAAGTGFSINEIIELSGKVASEVLEAALVEFREPFQINSKVLIRLAEAGVSPNVVDLMVALSFPEKFTVEPDTVSIIPLKGSGSSGDVAGSPYPYPRYNYIVDPFFPWYWTPSTYALYWYNDWGIWPGSYYYPNWPGPGHPGGEYRSSGRLVSGRGYTRIHQDSSTAKPRGSGGGSFAPQTSSRSGSNVSAAPSGRRGSASTAPSSGERIAPPPPSSGGSSAPPPSGGGSYSAPSNGSSGGSSGSGDGGGSGRTAKPR